MAVVVYNPTDEEMIATYIGLTDKILPEQKLKVDDARGRSYLNELGPRGLVQLEFGDEGDGVAKKADAGRRKCYEFRRKQILRYNQTNERQKQNGGAYQEPPDYIRRWSENLGLKLLEPFAFTDDASIRMADVKQENLAKDRLLAQKDVEMGELKAQMGTMQDQMNQLLAMLKSGQQEKEPAPAAVEVDLIETRKRLGYKFLNSTQFEPWVAKNWENIFNQPEEIQKEIKGKYADLYARPFPEQRPDLDSTGA
jgi:hypothetical protein